MMAHLKEQEKNPPSVEYEGGYEDAGDDYDGDDDINNDEDDYDGYVDSKEQFRGRNWTAQSGSTRF